LGLKDTPELRADFEAYCRGKVIDSSSKRLSALLKAPATAEYANELYGGNSGPLLIFTDHVEAAKLISQGVNGSNIITGSTPMDARQATVAAFQRGEIPALVATIGTMATGFTLTASRNVIFNDMSWTPSDNLQAEKRIHRIGQKNACVKHVMLATLTDSHIFKTLESKQKHINEALG
jgi:SWI/SNF-related matrix-associated actin-dependent regulator 1 of chromatin subfamily A